jgi:hypothetical protein
VYGQRHYIGPIRALTKWSAGVEINPHDFSTSRGRSKAITDYIQGASQRRKPSKASKVSKSSKAKAKASKESKDSDIPMGPITPANTAVTTIKWVFSGPSTSVHARSERETGAALVESGLLPNTTMRPARGVQVESSLLLPSPYDQHQQHSNANAQIESQLLPETFVDLARSVNIQEEVLKYSHWERY